METHLATLVKLGQLTYKIDQYARQNWLNQHLHSHSRSVLNSRVTTGIDFSSEDLGLQLSRLGSWRYNLVLKEMNTDSIVAVTHFLLSFTVIYRFRLICIVTHVSENVAESSDWQYSGLSPNVLHSWIKCIVLTDKNLSIHLNTISKLIRYHRMLHWDSSELGSFHVHKMPSVPTITPREVNLPFC